MYGTVDYPMETSNIFQLTRKSTSVCHTCNEPRIYWGLRTFFTDLFYELLTIDCMFFAAISLPLQAGLLLPVGGGTPINSNRHIINHVVPIVGSAHTRSSYFDSLQRAAGHEPWQAEWELGVKTDDK